MKIISALYDNGDRGYADMMGKMCLSVHRLGYSTFIDSTIADPMSRYDKKDNYFAPCYFKPTIIKNMLQSFKDDILWLDGDCLMRERVDEMLDDCDVAVTLRRWDIGQARNLYDGYINAGVMAFRNNTAAMSIVDKWIAELPGSRADQDALNKVLLTGSGLNSYGEIFKVGSARVKVLPCDIYNFFYFEDRQDVIDKAKIYHVKGHLRPMYYDLYVRKILSEVTK